MLQLSLTLNSILLKGESSLKIGSVNKEGIIEVIQTALGEGETYKDKIHFKMAKNKIYERWQDFLDKKDGVYI